MHETIQRTGPPCSKCKLPMAWHSDQEVHVRDGHQLMQVFECERCGRLTAYRVVSE
jgi:RNase P subunit RPR2